MMGMRIPKQSPKGVPMVGGRVALKCPKCGTAAQGSRRFCGTCGFSMVDMRPAKAKLTPIGVVALILYLLSTVLIVAAVALWMFGVFFPAGELPGEGPGNQRRASGASVTWWTGGTHG